MMMAFHCTQPRSGSGHFARRFALWKSTGLYLAMQFGIRAANYPFIADDMDNLTLPTSLKPLQRKLFG